MWKWPAHFSVNILLIYSNESAGNNYKYAFSLTLLRSLWQVQGGALYCMRPRSQPEESRISTDAFPRCMCQTVSKWNHSITLRQLLRHFTSFPYHFYYNMHPTTLFWYLCAPWVGLPAVKTHSSLPRGNPKLLRSLSTLRSTASSTEVLLLLYEFS